MFSKILFLVLLGTALVLAHPVSKKDNHDSVNPIQDEKKDDLAVRSSKIRNVLGTVQSWFVRADKAIVGVYDGVTAPFRKTVNLVIETGEGVMDYSKEKAEQLMVKYNEIKSKSKKNMNQIKSNFIMKVIDELQNVIDALSKQTEAGITVENLEQKTQEIADSSKEALEKFQQQLQQAIEEEKQKLEQNLNQWKQQADTVVKRRTG